MPRYVSLAVVAALAFEPDFVELAEGFTEEAGLARTATRVDFTGSLPCRTESKGDCPTRPFDADLGGRFAAARFRERSLAFYLSELAANGQRAHNGRYT